MIIPRHLTRWRGLTLTEIALGLVLVGGVRWSVFVWTHLFWLAVIVSAIALILMVATGVVVYGPRVWRKWRKE